MAPTYLYEKIFRESTEKTVLTLVDPLTQGKILARFDKLMDENKNADKHRISHLKISILPAIAVYQGCQDSGMDMDKAYRIAHAAMMKACQNSSKVMTAFGKLPFSFAILRRVAPTIMLKTYDDGLWNYDWIQNDKEALRVNAKSCPYYETCVHYGVPELAAIFCEGDDKNYGSMKHVGWGRTKTLAKGGDVCDFYFYKR